MSRAKALQRLARTRRCAKANRFMISGSFDGLAVHKVTPCIHAFPVHSSSGIQTDLNFNVARTQRKANGLTTCSVLRGLATGTVSDVSATALAKSLPTLSERPGRLTATQEMQIQQYRHALQDLLHAVERANGVASADVALLRGQLDRLSDGLFLLVVVGEYNSGKSSFINALLGEKVVAEGPVPTTAEVTLIRYAEDDTPNNTTVVGSDNVAVMSRKVDLLRTITLVDSPGTNAIDRRHEALTKEYLPMCDLVFFVTSADRPFSESERVFLKSIRSWGKKCILVINKADLLSDTAIKNEVVSFVKSSSRALLGSSPEIFSVSSRHAYEAKTSATGTHGPHWDASGFEALESFIVSRLNADERLRLKLDSVASVGNAVGQKYVGRLNADKEIVVADQAALEDVKNRVERCEQSVTTGFSAQFARVDNVLLEFLDRADIFIDKNVTVGNMRMMLRKDAIAEAFADQVVQGTARDIERRARKLAEWISDKSARNIADSASIFARRASERKAELLRADIDCQDSSLRLHFPSDVEGSVSLEQIVSVLSEAASELASTYKPENEGKRIADALSMSVITMIAAEISAIGILGALVSLSAMHPIGLASSGLLATGGFLVLPRRRQVLRGELRERVSLLRTRLEKELYSRISQQMSSHSERVLSAADPFASFTSSRATAIEEQLVLLSQAIDRLRRLQNGSGLIPTNSAMRLGS